MIWGLGFGVWGLGFGVWGLGFGVWGLGFAAGVLGLTVAGFDVEQLPEQSRRRRRRRRRRRTRTRRTRRRRPEGEELSDESKGCVSLLERLEPKLGFYRRTLRHVTCVHYARDI